MTRRSTWVSTHMPFFNQKIEGSQIIIDNVAILQPGDDIRKRIRSPRHAYKALVDTGATNTCISPKVAENVGLLPQGKKPLTSATQQQVNVNVYDVALHIVIEKIVPVAPKGGMNKQRSQFSVLSSRLQVTEFAQPANFDVLLGMDVLSECVLFISGGQFTLCY